MTPALDPHHVRELAVPAPGRIGVDLHQLERTGRVGAEVEACVVTQVQTREQGAAPAGHLLAQGRISHAPPLPVYFLTAGSSAHGVERHASLQAAGFHVPLVDYPGDGGLGLRLVVNAAHTAEEIDALALQLRR